MNSGKVENTIRYYLLRQTRHHTPLHPPMRPECLPLMSGHRQAATRAVSRGLVRGCVGSHSLVANSDGSIDMNGEGGGARGGQIIFLAGTHI